MKYVFVIHEDGADTYVSMLAEELAIRGIPTLVDHLGGFEFSTHIPDEARRLIVEECCGCIVYVAQHDQTGSDMPAVLTRDFVRGIEVPAALEARQAK